VAHVALARKYRPRSFAEVSTQEHVSETLRRAIATNRVAHAYLFCGPRGIGKTTLARVLAMALNCPERTEEGEPCGRCESCERIWSGHTSLDVVEIDAASNRGVDDARQLRERAMYAPSEEGRYKVYIVDEAHMLTREAWNALLKILEEPPPRVIFVFATTEPQKIQQSAAPILSRCQRFDFRRIGVGDITGRLREVVEGEGAEAPDEALRTLARKADGGMRDALSLLDQVLALTGGEIDQEDVRKVLGLVEEERYLDLLDLLAEGRHGDVFAFVESLVEEGYDLAEFYQGLVDVLRDLLRIRLEGHADAAELREDLREAFRERAEAFEAPDLVRMLGLVSELETSGSLRRSRSPRMLLEMLLLRLSYLDRTVDLETLIRRLGGEGDASAGRTPPDGGGDGGGGGPRPKERGPVSKAPPEGSPRPRDGTARSTPLKGKDGGVESGPASAEGSRPERSHLRRAWARLLESGKGVPRGMLPFLRAAEVRVPEEGVLEVALPEGPALERLSEASTLRTLQDALGSHGDAPARLRISRGEDSGAGGGGRERITPETLQRERVQKLLEREPLLEQAVEELDLEFLE